MEGVTKFIFAVCVGTGGVKEADAAVKGLAEKTDGLIQADALNRKGTEAVLGTVICVEPSVTIDISKFLL